MSPEALPHLALDLCSVGDNPIEAAVAHDQGTGLLGTDAGDARDVVRAVAFEAIEVWYQLGRDAVVEVLD